MRKVIFLSVLVALILAPLAMSAEKTVTFYGRAYVGTYINDKDSEYQADGNITNTQTNYYWDDTDTNWAMDTAVSRFGANFSIGDVSANVEIRPNNGSYYRHWVGKWKFSETGTLLVGQTWSPLFNALGESNMAEWGDFQGSLRKDGLQVHMTVGGGTLKIGALNPSVSAASAAADAILAPAGYTEDDDSTLPKLEVSYARKIGMVDMFIGGGYNTSTIEYHSATANAVSPSYDVDSWAVGGTFGIDFKPAYVKGYAYFGQNLANYGWAGLHEDAFSATASSLSGVTALNDVDYLGYGLIAGFVANDMFTFEGYYFHCESEYDYASGTNTTTTYESEGDAFGVIAVIKLADNVFVYPEIIRMDSNAVTITSSSGGTPSVYPHGSWTKYGIYWRINF